jgi:mandelamide amidase
MPADFWADLDSDVATVMHRALDALRVAGVVLVAVDLEDLTSLTHQAGFAIALHEIGVDIPAYLATHGDTGITLAGIAAQVASPDVRCTMDAVLRKDLAPQYELAMTSQRPRMQAIYARCFAEQRLDALVFPTVAVPPPLIDTVNGSPLIAVNDGPKMDFFALGIRNTDPGSTAGLPGITVPAGCTANGLPVGIALDGPIGSDARLLGLGVGIESVLG